MCAEHVEVLDVKWANAAREVVVELAVVIEEEHALLSNFLTSKVVGLHLNS